MSDTIQQIRALLSELEGEVNRAEHVAEFRALSGLELPDIIADVVDLLMPELKPYETAFYMYLLRHSIIENGAPGLPEPAGGASTTNTNCSCDRT